MPTLPRLGGPSFDAASSPTTSTGIAFTANASINTKATSWTEMIASTTEDVAWIMMEVHGSTTTCKYLFDIGIGASTSEQVLIPNLYHYVQAGASKTLQNYIIPQNVLKASRLSVRSQANVTVGALVGTMRTITRGAAGVSGLGRCEAFGSNTATSGLVNIDPGAVAHTDSTPYSELIASTGFDYSWITVVLSFDDNSTATLCTWLVDIALGAGGSELNIVDDLMLVVSGNGDTAIATFPIPKAIPAGSRISARARCSIATAADRVIAVGGWGHG